MSSDGYIVYDMAGLEATRTEADMIIMRFRTTFQDGVLFYADGNQGDYIAIELKRGYLHFKIDLGMSSAAKLSISQTILSNRQQNLVYLNVFVLVFNSHLFRQSDHCVKSYIPYTGFKNRFIEIRTILY